VPDIKDNLPSYLETGTCRTCKQVVTRNTNVCPECGEDQPAMTREEYIEYTGIDPSLWGGIKIFGSFFGYLTLFILQAIVGIAIHILNVYFGCLVLIIIIIGVIFGIRFIAC